MRIFLILLIVIATATAYASPGDAVDQLAPVCVERNAGLRGNVAPAGVAAFQVDGTVCQKKNNKLRCKAAGAGGITDQRISNVMFHLRQATGATGKICMQVETTDVEVDAKILRKLTGRLLLYPAGSDVGNSVSAPWAFVDMAILQRALEDNL